MNLESKVAIGFGLGLIGATQGCAMSILHSEGQAVLAQEQPVLANGVTLFPNSESGMVDVFMQPAINCMPEDDQNPVPFERPFEAAVATLPQSNDVFLGENTSRNKIYSPKKLGLGKLTAYQTEMRPLAHLPRETRQGIKFW